jgi:hypothetical protein
MSITNDEAMDSVCEAMTMIDTTSYESEDDWKEAKTLVSRLHETIKWIENVVDGDWEDEGTAEGD